MNNNDNPRLFGISSSNRDFKTKDSWGKNQFNSSFPTSLGCYMHKKGLNLKYIIMSENCISEIKELKVSDLYKTSPL